MPINEFYCYQYLIYVESLFHRLQQDWAYLKTLLWGADELNMSILFISYNIITLWRYVIPIIN